MKEPLSSDLNGPGGAGWNPAFLPNIVDLNTQVLGLLHEAAKTSAPAPSPLVVALRSQWLQLTPARLQALAGCPYLLLDLRGALPAQAGEITWSEGKDSIATEDPGWTELVRRALAFTWHLAHANPFSARILLGLPASGISAIAAHRLQNLQQLRDIRASAIRPRWEAQPDIWRKLLHAAIQGPPARLQHLQLWGLQLMASDLLRQTAEPPAARVNH